MKKAILCLAMLFGSIAMYADLYIVKYTVKGKASSTHATATLELKHGTAEEAKEVLLKRGTVGKQNADNLIIDEIKKK